MITRDSIRELAVFQTQEGDAITFYYQPDTPPNKSHREESILVKDLVKDAMRRAERNGKNGPVRADLMRILELAEKLHGNQGRAKAVFACGSKNYWREFDIPARAFAKTTLQMNNRFHLRPLTGLEDSLRKVCACLVDRNRARFFEMQGENISEQEGLAGELSRPRTDGFEGYDAGHVERRSDHEAANHFKRVAERLLERYGNDRCESIAIGCRDEIWPAIERQLHPYVKERLAGHFVIDPAVASPDEIRQQVSRLVREQRIRHRDELLAEAVDEARANNRGALGLRRVLRAMEQGEVQTLLIGEAFSAEGVECGNCGHIDMRMVNRCAVCGQEPRDIEDIGDALIGRALQANMEVIQIAAQSFEKAGNIGALLRFRAERSVGGKLA